MMTAESMLSKRQVLRPILVLFLLPFSLYLLYFETKHHHYHAGIITYLLRMRSELFRAARDGT